MESNFEKAIRETIEGHVLSHGMYCEVTREQAVELLTIEGQLTRPRQYVEPIFNVFENALGTGTIRFDESNGLVASFLSHGDHSKLLQFADFKQRLVNTVKG